MKNLPKTEGIYLPRLELFILDYDQTVVENFIDFYEAYCEALSTYGEGCLPYEDFIVLMRENKLQDKIPREGDQVKFWTTFRRLYRSRHSFPQRGLRELLLLLRIFNVKVVVVSGRETPSQLILWDLRRHGLDEFIDDVLTISDLVMIGGSEEFLFDKSSLIEYAMKKHGVTGVVLCVGDYVTDYYSCGKIGGLFIGLNTMPERNNSLKEAGVSLLAKDFYEVLWHISELGFLRG